MSTSTRIRVGIIGVGWGSVVQTPAFRAVPEYEVAALCSRRPESVAKAGAALEIADTSTDWEAFVRRDDLDVISVCTPVGLHAEQALAAVRAGKHVLVEKPQALTADDARQMLDAAESAGVAHAVCFEGRYEDHRLPVAHLVEDGFLGQVYMGKADTVGDYWHPSRGLQSEWMYKTAEGGGYLMGLSSHDIDFFTFLLGEPDAVCADVRSSVPERTRTDGTKLEVDADDTSVVLLRMRSGALVTISTSVVGLHHNRRELALLGSEGAITVTGAIQGTVPTISAGRADGQSLQVIPLSDRMPRSGVELPKRRAAGAIRSLALMLEDWLPAFDGNPAPGVPTLMDGWRVQRVVDAARRSSAGEGWIALA
ncbi:MAG: Gfo/Idh/MocA family protein [Acidimicrobiales bacterium]